MSILVEKIPSGAFNDIVELLMAQPWLSVHSDALTDLWNICDTVAERNLLKKLIKEFFILNANREALALDSLADQFKQWGLSPTSTWIVAAANKDEIDGAQAAMQKLKNKVEPYEEWHSRFISNIPAASDKVANGDVVVIFDDFLGTGNKLKTKANWLLSLAAKNNVDDLKIYFMSVAAMNFGINYLREQTQCEVFAFYKFDKAISDGFIGNDVAINVALMKSIESKLSTYYKNKNIQHYSLGYKMSEALYCVENDNCPNNVFPIFWWPHLRTGRRVKTILRRAG